MLTLNLPTPPKFKLTELKDKLPVVFTQNLPDETPPGSPLPVRPKLKPEIITTNHHNYSSNHFLAPFSPRSLKRPIKGSNLFPMTLKPQTEILTAEDFADLDELIKDLENFGKGGLTGGSRLSFFVPDEEPKEKKPPPPPQKEYTTAQLEELERRRQISEKLKTFNIKKLTTKIYIENNSNHKVVQLTSLSTPLLVIEGFIQKGFLPADNTWTLFEINSGFRCERYLRDWEPIMDVLEGWEPESSNVLILRRYSKKLTNVINAIPSHPPIFSSAAYLEVKSGKWEKRHLFLKKSNLFISKSNTPASASLLCSLSTFDAYNPIDSRKKAPTQFCLGLKSQDSILMFENPEKDYVHFLCFENKILLKNWSMAIYHSRNMAMWDENPDDQCLFVPPKYQVDSNEITTLEFDQGQFPELDPTVPFKTRMKAQKEANSKLRFLKNLFGSGDKKSDSIPRRQSEVFKKGSLLDAVQPPAPADAAQPKNGQADKVFVAGSLLAQNSPPKDVKPVRFDIPSNGPLVDASTPTPFQNGSLLDNSAQQQQQQQQQAKSAAPQRKAGPLVDPTPPKPFQNGSLLDQGASRGDKHRTLQNGPMVNIKANEKFMPGSGSLLEKTQSQPKHSSMMPANKPVPLNLNPTGSTPDLLAPTAQQIPESPLTPTRSQTINGTKSKGMTIPKSPRRTDSMPPKPRFNQQLPKSEEQPNELSAIAAKLNPSGALKSKFPPASNQVASSENKFNVQLRKVSVTPKEIGSGSASVKIKRTEMPTGIKNNPFLLQDKKQTSPPSSTTPSKLVDLEKGKKPQFQSGSLLANGAGAGAKKETEQSTAPTAGSLLANMQHKPNANRDSPTTPDSKKTLVGGLIDQAGIKRQSSTVQAGNTLVQLETK